MFCQASPFPKLSEFCKQLTSITQEQVDQGITLLEAVQELRDLALKHDALFCSWGNYDRKQLKACAKRFGVPYPFGEEHLNLKEAHRKFYGYPKPKGMKGALYYHDLPLAGTHHRGIDDARNICSSADDSGWLERMIVDPVH